MIYFIYNILKVYIIFEGVWRDRKILFFLLPPFLLTYSLSISIHHHPERSNIGIISSRPCLPECPSQSERPCHSLPLIALTFTFSSFASVRQSFSCGPAWAHPAVVTHASQVSEGGMSNCVQSYQSLIDTNMLFKLCMTFSTYTLCCHLYFILTYPQGACLHKTTSLQEQQVHQVLINMHGTHLVPNKYLICMVHI